MRRPNIVFIFSDQQRYSALACNGNRIVQTPHLDALAQNGVVLDNAFSSCPICAPYRGQLMTGKYAHANGCIDNEYALFPDQQTLPAVLDAAGYDTAYIGKWHLGYGPYGRDQKGGFSYMAANNCDHNHNAVKYYENDQGPFTFDTWAPTGETDLALRYIDDQQRRASDRPFCLVLSWGPPHWSGPAYDHYPEEFAIYDPDAVDLPPNVPPQLEAFARKELAHYYGNISALDSEVGRITHFLKTRGLADNTILCFSSDHGDHLSSHGYGKPMDMWLHHSKRASKATPYEESIHVPFVLSYPAKVAPGRRLTTMFSSVDIMPTLLGLAAIDQPEGIQGTDQSGAICGQTGPEPDSVYLQILGPGWPHRGDWVGFWRGVRTPRWLYARWIDSGDIWLFDRDKDPYEMENLAGRAACAEVQQQLEQRLQQWLHTTADPFETGRRDAATGILELGQRLTR